MGYIYNRKEVIYIGRVKVDIHKHDRHFGVTNLSDIEAIYGLLKYRPELDPYFYIHNYGTSDIRSMDEEVIVLYIDLDNIIEKCCFNAEQRLIIRLIQEGWSYNQINHILNIKNSRNDMIKICKEIKYQSDKQWLIWINKSIINLGWKKCTKCGEILPARNFFFTNKKDSLDGKHPYCNRCR